MREMSKPKISTGSVTWPASAHPTVPQRSTAHAISIIPRQHSARASTKAHVHKGHTNSMIPSSITTGQPVVRLEKQPKQANHSTGAMTNTTILQQPLDLENFESCSRNPLLCLVCNNVYEDPRLLACYHSFCAKCLHQGRVGENKILCPLCGKDTNLKDGNEPPEDLLLRFILHASTEVQPPCANCDNKGKAPMYYCNTCGQALCNGCREETHRAKMFSAHDIISVSKHAKETPRKCSVHGEQFIMFSAAQKSMLCINCYRDTAMEARHNCVDLDTAYNQGNRKLDKAVLSLRDLQVAVRDGITMLKNVLEELRRNSDSEKSALNAVCQTIIGALTKTQENLLRDVDCQMEGKDKVIRTQLNQLRSVLPMIKLHLTMCATISNATSKYDFLDLAYPLIDRLTAITHMGYPMRPGQSSQIKSNYKTEIARTLEPWISGSLHHQGVHPPSSSNVICSAVSAMSTTSVVSTCSSGPSIPTVGAMISSSREHPSASSTAAILGSTQLEKHEPIYMQYYPLSRSTIVPSNTTASGKIPQGPASTGQGVPTAAPCPVVPTGRKTPIASGHVRAEPAEVGQAQRPHRADGYNESFSAHCQSFNSQFQELNQRLKTLKEKVQQLHKDVSLQQGGSYLTRVENALREGMFIEDQLARRYIEMEKTKKLFEAQWNERLRQVATEQEIFQCQLNDLMVLQAEVRQISNALYQIQSCLKPQTTSHPPPPPGAGGAGGITQTGIPRAGGAFGETMKGLGQGGPHSAASSGHAGSSSVASHRQHSWIHTGPSQQVTDNKTLQQFSQFLPAEQQRPDPVIQQLSQQPFQAGAPSSQQISIFRPKVTTAIPQAPSNQIKVAQDAVKKGATGSVRGSFTQGSHAGFSTRGSFVSSAGAISIGSEVPLQTDRVLVDPSYNTGYPHTRAQAYLLHHRASSAASEKRSMLSQLMDKVLHKDDRKKSSASSSSGATFSRNPFQQLHQNRFQGNQFNMSVNKPIITAPNLNQSLENYLFKQRQQFAPPSISQLGKFDAACQYTKNPNVPCTSAVTALEMSRVSRGLKPAESQKNFKPHNSRNLSKNHGSKSKSDDEGRASRHIKRTRARSAGNLETENLLRKIYGDNYTEEILRLYQSLLESKGLIGRKGAHTLSHPPTYKGSERNLSTTGKRRSGASNSTNDRKRSSNNQPGHYGHHRRSASSGAREIGGSINSSDDEYPHISNRRSQSVPPRKSTTQVEVYVHDEDENSTKGNKNQYKRKSTLLENRPSSSVRQPRNSSMKNDKSVKNSNMDHGYSALSAFAPLTKTASCDSLISLETDTSRKSSIEYDRRSIVTVKRAGSSGNGLIPSSSVGSHQQYLPQFGSAWQPSSTSNSKLWTSFHNLPPFSAISSGSTPMLSPGDADDDDDEEDYDYNQRKRKHLRNLHGNLRPRSTSLILKEESLSSTAEIPKLKKADSFEGHEEAVKSIVEAVKESRHLNRKIHQPN